jgi:nonsense-mediated mRNA decay protein 3
MCSLCRIAGLSPLGIGRQQFAERCSTCTRYNIPPGGWATFDKESPEMLAYLLRRIAGLGKMHLVDAYFLHAEEHSKKIRLALIIDRTEELEGVEHREEIEVVYTIRSKQCLECARIAAKQTWNAVVQLRQRSENKRTLLQVEQSVMKAMLHRETTEIKGRADGIDFFFKTKTPALKLVRYIEGISPARSKSSEELVKLDKKSKNSSRYKLAFSVEILALDKDDLVVLPEKMASKLGLGAMVVVLKAAKTLSVIDTFGTVKDLGMPEYARNERDIRVIGTSRNLKEFVVIESSSRKQSTLRGDTTLSYGRNDLDDLYVVRSDGGCNDESVHTKSFVKGVSDGMKVFGYDLRGQNLEGVVDEKRMNFDVIVIRRVANENKKWRLRRIIPGPADSQVEKMLICDIAEDPALRKEIDIYDESDRLVSEFERLNVD